LEAARSSLRSGHFFVTALLCEQAVQKAMKGLFIRKKRTYPPRTHSLPELGRLLGMPSHLLHALRVLGRHYYATRYPDAAGGVPAEMYDRKTAEEAMALSGEVMEWIERNW